MNGRFVKKIKSSILLFLVFIKGVFFSRKLHDIDISHFKSYEIRGLRRAELGQFFMTYKKFSGNKLPVFSRLLYLISSRKFIFVAVSRCGSVSDIVGIDMYYCNLRDFEDRTIHEGFIGVGSQSQGQGIATELRRVAIAHFSGGKLTGISSRISLNNSGSLASARKLGFLPIEQYYDSAAREERYYLVRPLETCK